MGSLESIKQYNEAIAAQQVGPDLPEKGKEEEEEEEVVQPSGEKKFISEF